MFENHKKESPIVSLLGVGGGISYPGFIRRGVDGYTISRSLRFNSADSAYLNRTPSTAGNRKTWTWAGWVKLSNLSTSRYLFASTTATNDASWFTFLISNQNNLYFVPGYNVEQYKTEAVFRDSSAWYHVVFSVDTTQSVLTNRYKIYVNNIQQTYSGVGAGSAPSQDAEHSINNTGVHEIGRYPFGSADYFDGYLADVHFIDGQALDPSSFGEFDTNGVWQPIAFTPQATPNDGTVWSNSSVSGSWAFSDTLANAFDGNPTSVSRAAASQATTITLVKEVSFTTSVKLTGSIDNAGGQIYVKDGTDTFVNVSSGFNASSTVNTVDITSSLVSPIKAIKLDSVGNGYARMSYLEIDGVGLVDGDTSNIGANGFHLDFSDNSTAAALGTDTSGAGNTWTVNNISVAGSENYADYLTRFVSGQNKYNAFDGSTSTSVSQDLADGTGITFTPSPSISVTSQLRFYHTTGAPSTKEYIINGGSPVTTPNSGWVTTSFTGTLTSFVLRDNRGVGYGAALYAIEVDGTVLVDYRAVTGNDSLVDVPTNGTETDTGVGGEVRGNYATLNPLDIGNNTSISNGNLDVTLGASGGNWRTCKSSIGVSSGKWYFEATAGSLFSSLSAGIGAVNVVRDVKNTYSSFYSDGYMYVCDGVIGNNNAAVRTESSWTTGDVISVALDLDNNTIRFYKNGVAQGAALTGVPTATYVFTAGGVNASNTLYNNFGQRPFAYTAPSGFKALCTANLDAPVVTKPSEYMDVALYTGNGTSQTISGLEFSPDFVWIKERSGTDFHILQDRVRGAGFNLNTNNTNQETGNSGDLITSFNSDGFTVNNTYLGSPNTSTNGLNQTQVAWTWDAGSSTVTNNAGSITSQVRANTSAGFSIVTYTGDGTSGPGSTVGHGLGVAPAMVVTKMRSQNSGASSTSNWLVYHKDLNGNVSGDRPWTLYLNETIAQADSDGWGDYGGFTSSVFTVSDVSSFNAHNNNSTSTYVAYCFAPVEGYSAFGSYTGNGSADGPFVYTGFRPKYVLIKRTDSSTNADWRIFDTSRDPYNVSEKILYANLADAEGVAASPAMLDFLSNGFKLRNTYAGLNGSGATFVFAAFAESPFQYARAR